MKEMFRLAGIHNYTIWCGGNDLFGYYECDDVKRAMEVKSHSEVFARWNRSMSGLTEMCKNPDGSTGLERIFTLE